MSKGQYTVLVLLIALLGLEILRSPNVRSFFGSIIPGMTSTSNTSGTSVVNTGGVVVTSRTNGNTKGTTTLVPGRTNTGGVHY